MRIRSPQPTLSLIYPHMVSDKGGCLQYVNGNPPSAS